MRPSVDLSQQSPTVRRRSDRQMSIGPMTIAVHGPTSTSISARGRPTESQQLGFSKLHFHNRLFSDGTLKFSPRFFDRDFYICLLTNDMLIFFPYSFDRHVWLCRSADNTLTVLPHFFIFISTCLQVMAR